MQITLQWFFFFQLFSEYRPMWYLDLQAAASGATTSSSSLIEHLLHNTHQKQKGARVR